MYLDVDKIFALVQSSCEYKLAVRLKKLSKAGVIISILSSRRFITRVITDAT